MTTPVTLRGRAATPVRPGLVTKSVLLGVTPLATGELVTEASINDLHNAYKELVNRENAVRTRAKRLKPMTAFSFKTLFKFAQLLGLVELVREEPMQLPPPEGNLLSIRTPDGILNAHVVISARRIFKITPVGAEDERSWSNLCKAWIEQWPAPAKVEYLPPTYVPRVPKEKPPKAEKPSDEILEFTPYEWVAESSVAEFSRLAEHLHLLDSIGLASPGVTDEVARLSTKISGWIMELEEALDGARAIQYTAAIHRYEGWLTLVTTAKEALLDRELLMAASSLEAIVRSTT